MEQADTTQNRETSRETFSKDPGWSGRNNRPRPADCTDKVQDFGWSADGKIGGRIARSITPADYAKVIPEVTLEHRLRASGRFMVPRSTGGSGVLVGWFHRESRGWRTPNSLVFRLDGEPDKVRVLFEYGTRTLKTGGGQTFEGRYQTTKTPMIPADGTPHVWTLDYDPNGARGAGEITFSLDGKEYRAALAEGHRKDGAVFDRFGILNQQLSGKDLTLWLDSLVIDGRAENLSRDPRWEARGSRARFRDCGVRPLHNFGFTKTRHAGGDAGEIGGVIWRIESTRPQNFGSYARSIGRLSLDDELVASGRVNLRAASSDSAVLIGWFNSFTPVGAPPLNFVGVLIEGPSRIGHYFRPALGTSDEQRMVADRGPVIRPGSASHTWRFHYVPRPDGSGRMTVALDGEVATYQVDAVKRKGNATFDRFGILSWNRGGHFLEVYIDDLELTVGADVSSG